jgi:hypothetical protein
MKFYVIFISIFISQAIFGQSPILPYNTFPTQIPDNAYVKDLDNEIEKFTGTWVYTDANKEFIVVLQKREQVYNGSHYIDKLSGQYKYTVNGQVVVDTFPFDVNINPKINGAALSDVNKNIFWLNVTDPGKIRAGYRLTLELLPEGRKPQLKWDVLQTGFVSGYYPGQTPPTPQELDQTMRIPKSIILTKQ